MESRCGNKLHGAPAVLHLKTARSSLINMKNFNEKYNFPLTANILKYLGKTGYMGSKSSLEDFVKYGKFQVRKITEYCENIQKNLIFLLKTYPKNKSLLKIKKITYQIKNKKTLLYCQFDKKKSTKEIKSVIESYVEYINKWKQILKERKTNK